MTVKLVLVLGTRRAVAVLLIALSPSPSLSRAVAVLLIGDVDVVMTGDPPISLNLLLVLGSRLACCWGLVSHGAGVSSRMLLGSRRSVADVPVGRSAAAGLVLKPTSGSWSRGAAAELLSAPKPVISPQLVSNK